MNWNWKKFTSAAALLLIPAMLSAQIVSARIFQQDSDYKFDEDILALTVLTRKGAKLSGKIVDDDVKRLAGRGVFADVSASTRILEDGTAEVTFHLIAKPVVNDVLFEGNEKISTEKLREQIQFSIHTPMNDVQVTETANRIRQLYKEAGREGTQVSVVSRQAAGGALTLVFRIQEELRIRVHSVSFEGNTVYTDDELDSAIETGSSFLSAEWLSWIPFKDMPPGLYTKQAVERDKMRLRELYLRKGYLDFRILSVKTAPVEENPELVDVLFTVEEGEPYYVGDISVSGTALFPAEDIRKQITQTSGNVFDVRLEDADVRRIETMYAPEGYADFRLDVIRKPDYLTHTVNLEYKLDEGPQYTIGKVEIAGNKWTKPHVLLREMDLTPGDKVNRQKLEVARLRLLGLNYFEPDQNSQGVDVLLNQAEDPGKKDVLVNVNEKQFGEFHIGGGWSDGDGLAGMISASHNNMDILDPMNWFTGGGQRMRLYALVGTERKDAVAEFTEPWLFGIPLRWNTSFYWREYEYDDWDEYRLGFTTSLKKRFFDDFTAAELGYTFEQVQIRHMDRKLSAVFQDQKGREFVGRIFLNLERDTRDSYVDPRSGYLVSLYGGLTTQGLGATKDYYKVELKAINHLPFLRDLFVLSTGFRIGMMDAFGNDHFVPLFDRYFLGGGSTVRGFPYRSIGPVDQNEDNYGGEFMYLFTAELTHPIYKDYLRGGVFCDVGAVSKRSFKFEDPCVGIGYGLRIKLPKIPMPIRLDLAWPVVNNQDGVKDRLRFHFNFGFQF